MASTVKLLTYFVQVNESHTSNFEDLSGLPDGHNICNILFDFLSDVNDGPVRDEQSAKVMTRGEPLYLSENALCGFIGGGGYGFEADGVDINNGNRVFTRREDHTVEIPFYFQLRVFPGVDKGVLTLMQYGRRGMKTILEREFKDFFQTYYEDYTLKINPMAPRGYVNQLVRGGVRSIRYIKRTPTDDDADRVRNDGWPENAGKMRMEYVAEHAQDLLLPDAIREYIEGEMDWTALLQVSEVDFDTLKVEVRFGSGTRVVDLSRLGDLSAKFDVTEDVTLVSGLPTFESIHEEASSLIEDIVDDQGIPDNAERSGEIIDSVTSEEDEQPDELEL